MRKKKRTGNTTEKLIQIYYILMVWLPEFNASNGRRHIRRAIIECKLAAHEEIIPTNNLMVCSF